MPHMTPMCDIVPSMLEKMGIIEVCIRDGLV